MIGKTNAINGTIKTKQLVGKGTLPFSTSDSKRYTVSYSEAVKIDTTTPHQIALDSEIYECTYGTLVIYHTSSTSYYRANFPANDSTVITMLTTMLSDTNGNLSLDDGRYYIDVYLFPTSYLKYVFQCLKITVSNGTITNVDSFYSYNQYESISSTADVYLYGIRHQ